jgi:uncharacterized membrane protein YedE/YeeE
MGSFLPALLAGTLLGAGIALSDMINPARVLAFLDVAGAWDATLVFVMAGAVGVAGLGFALRRWMRQPFFAARFFIPENHVLERRLVVGSVLFGIGWGLVGLCPGPAVAGLIFSKWQTWLFFGAMLVGMLVHRMTMSSAGRRQSSAATGA